jgi:hypothetical protein
MVVLKHEQLRRLAALIGKTRGDKVEFGKYFFGKDLRDSPWQMEAVNMGGQVSTKVAGRRSGKTLTTTIDIAHECATHRGWDAYVTGPSLDQASLYFNEIEEAANHPNGLMEALIDGEIKRSPFPTVKLVTGSTIHARSTARDGVYLRGKGANIVAATEAAFIKDKVYQEVIRAMVLDRGGMIRLESTPNGDNYFRQLHELANDPDKRVLLDGTGRIYTDPSGYYRTVHATVYDNLKIDREEIDRIRLEVPEWVWRVEYLAEFLANQESIFSWGLLTDLFDEDYPMQMVPLIGHRYCIGVDLAQVNDYTCICVLDVTWWPVTVATYMHYRGKPYTGESDSVVSDVNTLRAIFNDARVIIDATMERAVAEQIVGAEAFTFTQSSRNLLLSNLQVLAQNRKYQLPAAWTRLRDEMRFLRRIKRGQSVRIDHPAGQFDDTVMALALASWPLRTITSPGDEQAVAAITQAQFA